MTLSTLALLLLAADGGRGDPFAEAYQQWTKGSDPKAEARAEKALEAWRTAAPDDVPMLVACSNLRANQAVRLEKPASDQRFGESIGCLRQALKLRPTRLDLHFGLLAILRMAGRWSEVEAALTVLLGVTRAQAPAALRWMDDGPMPENPELFVPKNILAYVHNEDFDWGAAARVIKAVTEQYPKCGECWNTRASFVLRDDRASKEAVEEGLGFLRQSFALLPKDVMVQTNLGVNELRAGHEAEGLKTLEAVLRAGPEDRQLGKVAHFAGPIWAKASPLHFNESKLKRPQLPFHFEPDGGVPASGKITGELATAVSLSFEPTDASTLATAWCKASKEKPSIEWATSRALQETCRQWKEYEKSLTRLASADLVRLKQFNAAKTPPCEARRAAIFGFLEAWPDADQAVAYQAFELFRLMKPCG